MNTKVLSVLVLMVMIGTSFAILSSQSGLNNEPNNKAVLLNSPYSNSNTRIGKAWNLNVTPFVIFNNSILNSRGTYNVSQIRSAYNLSGFYNKNFCGQGETIAIVDAYGDPDIPYDLNSFDSEYNLPSASISYFYPCGPPNSNNSSWAIETATDVEWFHAIAPKAHIDLIIVPNAAVGYLQAGVNDTVNNISNVNAISMSWGIAESKLNGNLLNSYNNVFKLAKRKDIHVFAASGDLGAYDGTKDLTVNFPATDPYITSVGGTTLSSKNGIYSQTAWDKSGGGFSEYFHTPFYQIASGYCNTYRGVPDISAIANPITGVNIFSEGQIVGIGGTSLATPIMAASFLLIDQSLKNKLGFINPILYNLSKTNQYGKAIVPVPDGNNGYYNATNNWNPVTGLGSINACELSKDISRIYSYYGYELNYSYINASKFSFSANLTIQIKTSSNAIEMLTVGDGNSVIKVGLIENGTIIKDFISAGKTVFYGPQVSSTDSPINASISFNTDNVKLTVGSFSKKLQLFPENVYGSSAKAIYKISDGKGVPVSGNTANISDVLFQENSSSSISAISGNPIVPFGMFNNSVIKIINTSNVVTLNFNKSNPSGNFIIHPNPLITIKIMQKYPAVLTIKAPKNSHITINGNIFSATNYTLNSSESLKIKVKDSLTSITYKYNIEAPEFTKNSLKIAYADSKYQAELFSTTLDYTSSISAMNNSLFSSIGSCTNISTSAYGFYEYVNQVPSNKAELNITERQVYLTFDVSPINAKLKLSSGSELYDHNGTIIYSVIPSNISFNLSVKIGNYKPFSSFLNLIPGENVSYEPTSLQGLGKGYFLNGTVENQYFYLKYGISLGIFNASISYKNVSAFSNKFGCFSIWLPINKENVSASAMYFYSLGHNYTMSANLDIPIYLVPNLKFLNLSVPSIQIDRLIPLFLFTAFISWSTSFQSGVANFEICYKATSSSTWSKYDVGSSTDHIAVIPGILPGNTYDVKVKATISGGSTITSPTDRISFSSPLYLLLNILIFIGIIFFAYSIYLFFKRKKHKKRLDKTLEEYSR
jgi:subtilase family serine protease